MDGVTQARASEEALIVAALEAEKSLTPVDRVCHPAWVWQGPCGSFVTDAVKPCNGCWFTMRCAEEEVAVGVPLQPAFPILEQLCAEGDTLPEALFLAAVEREGAAFLDALSQLFGAAVQVVSRRASPPAEATLWWGSWRRSAEDSPIQCCWELTPALAHRMAAVGMWVATHPALAQEALQAQVVLATFPLPSEERSTLAAGDALSLPEWTPEVSERRAVLQLARVAQCSIAQAAETMWVPQGSLSAVPAEEEGMVSVWMGAPLIVEVAQVLAWCRGEVEQGFVVPQESRLALVQGGRRLAWGRLDRLGEQAIFAIDGVEG